MLAKYTYVGEIHNVASHSIRSKLGYIMKRGRPDNETSISFLMKRVSKSDKDDWGMKKDSRTTKENNRQCKNYWSGINYKDHVIFRLVIRST